MSSERLQETEDGKLPRNGKQPSNRREDGDPDELANHPLTHIASSLAMLFLEKQLKKGKGVDIPSLGIRVDANGVSRLPLESIPEDLREQLKDQ
jgi:hypothetical protein